MNSSANNTDYKELMANSLALLKKQEQKLASLEQKKSEAIAIIGIGCRFPGNADNPAQMWDLLINGRDATTEIPSTRWDVEEYYDPDENQGGKMMTCRGGFLSSVDTFDAQFFNISSHEAVFIDPQQRLLMEVAWEALENANIPADSLKGSKTGVFVGISTQDYSYLINEFLPKKDISGYIGTGTSHSSAAGRLSYTLGLTGPSVAFDTACSSSLVAVHNAVESLRRGECNMALVGGVSLILSPMNNIVCSKAQMLSPDGRCKPFAETADGYGRSEGVGVVVLKRLSDAIADGDRIMAQIRGSAINHNGASARLTVLNGPAQQTLIRQALQNAKVDPADLSYIETHSTGTALADLIELGALDAVFGETHSQSEPLLVGSFKSNVGHMEAASGMGGLIKLVLQLQHQEIPPLLHMQKPNSEIAWDKIPINVPTQRIPWKSRNNRRVAGLSSFGFSGTNAHVILEEAPSDFRLGDASQNPKSVLESLPRRETLLATFRKIQNPKFIEPPQHLLTLSAKTEEALLQLAERYEEYLATTTAALGDICFTANTGRSHFNHRLSVVASSSAELREKLAAFIAGQEAPGVRKGQVQGTLQDVASLPSLSQEDSDWEQILENLGELYVRGARIDWSGFDRDYARSRVQMPTYQFQRQRYWVETTEGRHQKAGIFNLLLPEDTEQLTQQLEKAGELSEDEVKLLPKLLELLVKQHQQQHPAANPLPLLKEAQTSPQGHELLQLLVETTASERQALLVAYIQEQIATDLGISKSQLDVDQPINYLGLDSVMAVDLRNRLRIDLEVDVPLVKFLDDSSVTSLAMQVSGRLKSPQEDHLRREDVHTFTSYPLSYGQQGLWFLYQIAPKSAAYNLAFTAHIRSNLNVPALQRAFGALIARHPTLRTTFGQRGAELVQEVHEYQQACFEETDASTWNWDELTSRAVEAYRRPFDLERGPVVRVSLFTRSTQDYILLLTIHHIVVDGSSFGILLDELRLLYQAENAGQAVSLPPINWQYTNYVQWQTQMLASPAGEKLWAYWQKQLAGELPVLNLPTDRPRPPIQTYHGTSHSFELSQELTSLLRRMVKTEGVTLYMTLLAAFLVLLHRYTGQEDILVGSPINNRSQPEFAGIVGFFVNMLALRVDLAGSPTFSALLTQVRHMVLDALAHQDYPSPLLVERLHLHRSTSLPPLFQVSFNLLKLQQTAEVIGLSMSSKARAIADWGGLSLLPFEIAQQEGQNDLVFDVIETTGSLLGIFRYNTDLFDATTISRMAGHFQTLLEGIVANLGQQISSLPLLTADERDHLLVWNNTQVEYPQDKCIHQLFEAQVELTPDAVAVVFEDQHLTYQELNARANKIAHYLQALGVEPEMQVGICVDRSLEMVVGLLAILKAGGAYVPLDPRLPQERLSLMLSSQVSVLLTTEKLVAHLPEHNAHLVCLDTEWEVIAKSEENPVSEVIPTNLAYVIYTSGSTGTPKGVMIPHCSLVNAYLAWEDTYQLRSRTSSHLQMASFSFDVFSGDLVRALCSGAKLVICPREWLLVPEKLYGLMREEEVDCAEFVPAVLRNLIEYLKTTEQNLNFMQLLIVGSDSWSVKEYEEFRHFCDPQTRLINSYGVSEATIDSCYFESAEVNLPVDELVPIGRPFANTQIYILDRHLQPVPIGVPGELHISGAGLGNGYLNRPDLTESKFIPHPFTYQTYSRLYKTGDLARYLPDGNIELVGRIDNQVKIRGFRIELDEIEAVLTAHPEVREAIVIVREDQPGNKRLVAYIVPKVEPSTISELRSLLKQKLPDYMVPFAFMSLEAMPLTPNGKIDRSALRAPDTSSLTQEASFVPPRNTLEQQLAQIWSEVLDVHPVGVRDNFFDLGGHSLSAVRLMGKIQQQFEKNLPLATLFQGATIEHLASILQEHSDSQPWSPLVAIQPDGNRTPLFCIHPVGGNVLCYMDLAHHLGLEQPVYGLQSLGLNGEQEILKSIEDMATHYIKALQTIQPQGPYHIGGWSLGGVVAFDMAQQLYQQGHEVALLALIDSYAINMPKEIDEAMLVVSLAKDLGGLFGQDLPVSVDQLQQLTLEEQLNYILEQAKIVKILPPEFGQQQMRQMLRVFLTNFQAMYRYIPHPYPGRITLFCASEKIVEVTQDPSQGWGEVAAGGLETHKIKGDHYTILREPHVQILAKQIGTNLNARNPVSI